MNAALHSEHWLNEYHVQLDRSVRGELIEFMLGVVFDAGAHRRFSRVHISLCCEDSVPPDVRYAWQLAPLETPTPLSVTGSTHERLYYGLEITNGNVESLPPYHLIFDITWHSVSNPPALTPGERPSGRLIPDLVSGILRDGAAFALPPPKGSYPQPYPDRWQLKLRTTGESQAANSSITVLELELPLADDTQAVFTSFTCTQRLFHLTRPRRDGQYDLIPGLPTQTARIVRIIPILRDRKAIPLPPEVLLNIFGNIPSPHYKDWRTDLVSFALVCRGWSCALDLLLSDFRSPSWQNSYRRPPEITGFANALAMRPRLGLSITSLSANYFDGKPPDVAFSSGNTLVTEPDVKKRQPHEKLDQSASAFLTILRLAKNVKTLSIDSTLHFIPLDDVVDALRGLHKLEELTVDGSFCMKHITSWISLWPSLKRLSLSADFIGNKAVPVSPPPCALTDLSVHSCAISDKELIYLISASPASLQRLSFISPSTLTNSGLSSALHLVSKSLVELRILRAQFNGSPMFLGGGEDHALDTVIVHMERLQRLEIVPEFATSLMLQRRADAFEESRRAAGDSDLPVVFLTLIGHSDSEIVIAANASEWPGWKIMLRPGRGCVLTPRPMIPLLARGGSANLNVGASAS